MRKRYIFVENTGMDSIMMIAAQYLHQVIGCDADVGVYWDEKPLEEVDNRIFREVNGAFIPYDELPSDFYDNFGDLTLFHKIRLDSTEED